MCARAPLCPAGGAATGAGFVGRQNPALHKPGFPAGVHVSTPHHHALSACTPPHHALLSPLARGGIPLTKPPPPRIGCRRARLPPMRMPASGLILKATQGSCEQCGWPLEAEIAAAAPQAGGGGTGGGREAEDLRREAGLRWWGGGEYSPCGITGLSCCSFPGQLAGPASDQPCRNGTRDPSPWPRQAGRRAAAAAETRNP